MVLYEETLEDIKDFENFKNKLSDSLKSLYDDIDFYNNTKITTKWEDRNIEKYKIIINDLWNAKDESVKISPSFIIFLFGTSSKISSIFKEHSSKYTIPLFFRYFFIFKGVFFLIETIIPLSLEQPSSIEKYLNPLLFSFVFFTTTDKYGFDESSIAILHFGNFVSIVTSNFIIYYIII